MSYKNKIPLTGLSIGDKVKSKDLIKNNLRDKSVLLDEVKTWTVEDIQLSSIAMRNGKKAPVVKRKTLVILTAKRNGKTVRTRVWWTD